MKAISSKEFNTNQKKYSEMAVNEEVCDTIYSPLHRPYEIQYPEQEILEPDEDLCSAITAEKLLEMLHEDIHQMFNEKK